MMGGITKNKLFIFLLITAVVIIIDQITKQLANRFLNVVHNYGAAFGLFQNANLIFIFVALIVIGAVIYYYKQIPNKASVITYVSFIFAGTIANLIDRIRLGYVIDFIDFKIWPFFNIADTAITIGVIGLIIYLLQRKS